MAYFIFFITYCQVDKKREELVLFSVYSPSLKKSSVLAKSRLDGGVIQTLLVYDAKYS